MTNTPTNLELFLLLAPWAVAFIWFIGAKYREINMKPVSKPVPKPIPSPGDLFCVGDIISQVEITRLAADKMPYVYYKIIHDHDGPVPNPPMSQLPLQTFHNIYTRYSV